MLSLGRYDSSSRGQSSSPTAVAVAVARGNAGAAVTSSSSSSLEDRLYDDMVVAEEKYLLERFNADIRKAEQRSCGDSRCCSHPSFSPSSLEDRLYDDMVAAEEKYLLERFNVDIFKGENRYFDSLRQEIGSKVDYVVSNEADDGTTSLCCDAWTEEPPTVNAVLPSSSSADAVTPSSSNSNLVVRDVEERTYIRATKLIPKYLEARDGQQQQQHPFVERRAFRREVMEEVKRVLLLESSKNVHCWSTLNVQLCNVRNDPNSYRMIAKGHQEALDVLSSTTSTWLRYKFERYNMRKLVASSSENPTIDVMVRCNKPLGVVFGDDDIPFCTKSHFQESDGVWISKVTDPKGSLVSKLGSSVLNKGVVILAVDDKRCRTKRDLLSFVHQAQQNSTDDNNKSTMVLKVCVSKYADLSKVAKASRNNIADDNSRKRKRKLKSTVGGANATLSSNRSLPGPSSGINAALSGHSLGGSSVISQKRASAQATNTNSDRPGEHHKRKQSPPNKEVGHVPKKKPKIAQDFASKECSRNSQPPVTAIPRKSKTAQGDKRDDQILNKRNGDIPSSSSSHSPVESLQNTKARQFHRGDANDRKETQVQRRNESSNARPKLVTASLRNYDASGQRAHDQNTTATPRSQSAIRRNSVETYAKDGCSGPLPRDHHAVHQRNGQVQGQPGHLNVPSSDHSRKAQAKDLSTRRETIGRIPTHASGNGVGANTFQTRSILRKENQEPRLMGMKVRWTGCEESPIDKEPECHDIGPALLDSFVDASQRGACDDVIRVLEEGAAAHPEAYNALKHQYKLLKENLTQLRRYLNEDKSNQALKDKMHDATCKYKVFKSYIQCLDLLQKASALESWGMFEFCLRRISLRMELKPPNQGRSDVLITRVKVVEGDSSMTIFETAKQEGFREHTFYDCGKPHSLSNNLQLLYEPRYLVVEVEEGSPLDPMLPAKLGSFTIPMNRVHKECEHNGGSWTTIVEHSSQNDFISDVEIVARKVETPLKQIEKKREEVRKRLATELANIERFNEHRDVSKTRKMEAIIRGPGNISLQQVANKLDAFVLASEMTEHGGSRSS